MKTLIIIFLFVFIVFLAPVFAQTQIVSQAAGAVSPNPDSLNEMKLAVLNKELQVTKEFTQHILATVYFCLGTVVVVLFAMVGFGWFQNVRAYERDKEALRQALSNTINELITQKAQALDTKAAERFQVFDSKMAEALENSFQQLRDIHLVLETSIFRATHTAKTPRTDFMVLLGHIERAIGKVSPSVLNQSLSVIIDRVGDAEKIDSPTRTHLFELMKSLPPESAGIAERLRDLLTNKSE
jgi:hypothetical protein